MAVVIAPAVDGETLTKPKETKKPEPKKSGSKSSK